MLSGVLYTTNTGNNQWVYKSMNPGTCALYRITNFGPADAPIKSEGTTWTLVAGTTADFFEAAIELLPLPAAGYAVVGYERVS